MVGAMRMVAQTVPFPIKLRVITDMGNDDEALKIKRSQTISAVLHYYLRQTLSLALFEGRIRIVLQTLKLDGLLKTTRLHIE